MPRLQGEGEDALVAHCQAIAEEIPLVGFYLQPSVGGIALGAGFWRRFAQIDNVVAIKVAPFNRYRTLDVVRGVAEARAEERISLYTGNDDHIVLDLVTPYTILRDGEAVTLRFRGGLLGHWSVWVRSAVELLERVKQEIRTGAVSDALLALDSHVTDCNAAFFDVANEFRGCIAGCHEVLRRQGLLAGNLVPRPKRGPEPRAEGGDRPCLRAARRSGGRRVRPGEPRAVVGVSGADAADGPTPQPSSADVRKVCSIRGHW